jgi:DNA (cytosine-5)-methyltransferase 1
MMGAASYGRPFGQPATHEPSREERLGPPGGCQAQREPFKVLSLFAGIGGFDLGLERTGWFKTVAFCEIDPFCRRVLAKHWPEVPCYHDVRELTAERLIADGIAIDVICGGFPCQDISAAGIQAGMGEGTRSGLWSEFARLIRELRPSHIIVENVAALLRGPVERPGEWFGAVLRDLAECGYDAEWENIPAAALGAPHRRERIWLVAFPHEDANPDRRISAHGFAHAENIWQRDRRLSQLGASPRLCGSDTYARIRRVVYGIPGWAQRCGALGNAVVPAIPELIGRAILEAEAA